MHVSSSCAKAFNVHACTTLAMQDHYLKHCKQRIEDKLGWGPSAQWATQDFEELSFQIQEKTSEVISATTLKRIWGRVAYDSNPSRHSLDALSIFLGYASWRDFTSSVDLEPKANVAPKAPEYPSKRRMQTIVIPVFMLLLGAASIIWLGVKSDGNTADGAVASDGPIKFVSRQLANDLPNTVVFEYDVSNVTGDSFFIQQSWDSRRRARISSDNTVHSSIYYFPGYYSAKLIANDSIVKELPVHVKTDNWAAMLVSNMPVYLPEEVLSDNGTLGLSKANMANEGFELGTGDNHLGFYYVQDFGPLHSDNFSMETVVRHEKPLALGPCAGAQITIRAVEGVLKFPLDVPGCAGDMHVIGGEMHQTGDSYDFGNLGADYSSWQEVSLSVEDRDVTIQVGTNPPYTFSYTRNMGKVVGMWFEFSGYGAIDEVTLKDGNGRIIYEEAF